MRDYRLPYISVVKHTPQPPKKEDVVPPEPTTKDGGRELVLVIEDYIKMTEHFGK